MPTIGKWLICLWCARCIDNNNIVAGKNTCSRIWAISGSSDALVLFYGPIGIVLYLGFHGGGKEGSQNMGGREAIWCC